MHTILHVDTSETFRHILGSLFTKAGFLYLGAGSRSLALQLLEENPEVRLIITALEMDDSNGEDFLKFLNTGRWKEIPVVVISSHDTIEARKRLFSLGAVDYIPKSAGAEKLLDHVRTLYVERLKQEDEIRRALQSMQIAVLDDSKTELNLIRQLFELHDIRNVSYFLDANELLEAGPFALFLIDVILPNFSGEQVILKLKQDYRESMIVAISAIDHYKTVSNVILSGADDYIIKPFNTTIFMARMKAAARSWVMLQDLQKKQTQLESTNKLLQEMVVRDSLTQLYNHAHIYERLEAETKIAARYKRPLSVLMLDVDHFKSINDQFGHQKGDYVLQKLSEEINQNFRDVDIKGRYGGEEFMVVLPETTLESAVISAERLRKNIEEIEFDDRNLHLSISGGLATYQENDRASDMIRRADSLLYDAKKAGRNKILH